MADSSSPSSNNSHIPSSPSKPPKKSKFLFLSNYFVTKSFMIILVLLVFSFFPSQVPEIFKETTLIPKLWDLIYLLVIGIAVSYGLLSRKSSHPSDDDNNNIVENETYLSGISHISSIFEEGNHGIYGFDDKYWVEGIRNSGSRSREFGDGKKMQNQGFLGESLVVINDENFVLEQLGSRQKRSKQNLGSKSLDSAVGKSVVEDSDSDSTNWFKESKSGKFRGLMPVKLEQKFKETETDSGSDSDSRTRLNWCSKSMTLEKRDDMFTDDVDESGVFDFEDIKSQPVRFGMTSKIKNLSEKEESKGVDAVEVNRRYRKPYTNGETSFVESKLQESSTGGSSEMNSWFGATEIEKDFNGTLDGSSEEIVKDSVKIKVDDRPFDSSNKPQFVKSKSQSSSSIGAASERDQQTFKNMLRKEEKSDITSSVPKPATNANSYKRGKSVRTSRLKEQVLESKVNKFQSQTDDEVETRSKLRVKEMDVKADELSDVEPHSGEVDRKAEEFIAKFREQIRLQKVASARKLNLL